ncbi:MAG: hypothetical protein GY774_10150, partial [Planctomycetes bacterium]|nr:hypothetical protein [Planctomycetota bacterium]
VYFYNTETGSWSQDGIANVEHLTVLEDPNLPSDVHAIRCNADHFTAFGSGGGAASIPGGGGAVGGGGGGGGGCSVSAADEGNIVEFLLPYIGFIIVLVILTVRDSRIRNARREYRNREIIKQDH